MLNNLIGGLRKTFKKKKDAGVEGNGSPDTAANSSSHGQTQHAQETVLGSHGSEAAEGPAEVHVAAQDQVAAGGSPEPQEAESTTANSAVTPTYIKLVRNMAPAQKCSF